MIFNIFKTLLCAFLIFLSCFIADVRGKSINELEELDSSELNSKDIEETTSDDFVRVTIAGPCDPNPCENGGSCITRIDYVEGFVCYCPVGFAGKKCEIVEDNNCHRGDCENATCNCCPGWGLLADSCKECKCGKQFNCTFSPFALKKTCLCGTGYTEEYGTCKADCKKNPCKNGGACLVIDYEVRCRCIEPYAGEFCEKNKCDGMNCQNNRTCHIIEGIAVCACPDGYTGDDCEKHVCDGMNCQNNGTCYMLDGKAVCKCPDGYTGDECEKLDLCSEVCGENPGVLCEGDKTNRDAIMCFCKDEEKIFDQEEKECKVKEDPCTNDPCLNGGQCIVTGTSFNCICKEPYFGKFCETNLCDQYICKNGGTCKVIREQPKCFCKEPYSGKFCDIRMDDCVTNFCENGGICRTMNGEPKCFCTGPYGGKFCNTRTDLRYNSTVFAVVYMLLGLVLISIGVLISCLLCRRICLGRK